MGGTPDAAPVASPHELDVRPVPGTAPGERPGRVRELDAILNALAMGLRHLDDLRGGSGRFLVGVSGGVDSSLA